MAQHIPPSQIKYRENHPEVRFRVPAKLKDDLHVYAESKGYTLGVLLSHLLKNQKHAFADFNEGYAYGYTKATIGANLEIACSECGTPLKISQQRIAEFAEKMLKLRHVKCPYCDEERQVVVSKRETKEG